MRRLNLQSAYGWQNKLVPGSSFVKNIDKSRLMLFRVAIACFLSLITIRLVKLQVVEGGNYRIRSDDNRIFERRVIAPRGIIRDRNGEPLVVNQPVYKLLTNENGKIQRELTPISREEALKLDAQGDASVVYDIGRFYPKADLFAHLIGYVGLADEKQVSGGNYVIDEWVGKTGIEKTYTDVLAGEVGSELIEVDAVGRVIRRVEAKTPEPGKDLKVYIDAGLQSALYKAIGGRKGAAVATNPKTGEVLAFVSSPSFDPNWFSTQFPEQKKAKQEEIGKLFGDESKPMLNRVTGGIYPPGSVFKVVTATAGLENEIVTESSTVEDTGEIRIDEYTYRNWFYTKYGGKDGLVDVVAALKRSNDIYFYKLGEWIGPTDLGLWSREFGLGEKTGVDVPGEVDGLVPTPLWKEKAKGERWFLGNTYHFSIGQGDLLTTPIQVNQMMSVIASGGRWCKPRVVESSSSGPDNKVLCRQLNVSNQTMEIVRKGLVAACQPGGTAFPFFGFDLSVYGDQYQGDRSKVACKTGTAQFFDPEDRTHAWFSVFAPAVDPEIVVTVLIEAGGEGSAEAAPVALSGLKYWFGGEEEDLGSQIVGGVGE